MTQCPCGNTGPPLQVVPASAANYNSPNRFSSPNSRGEKNLSGPKRTYADRSGPTRPIPHSEFCLVPVRKDRISPGPTTRQYPAIPGNMRTKVQFLAAYCRLSVRLLPRNQFPCRIKPRNVTSPRFAMAPSHMPRAFRFNCQRTCSRRHKCSTTAQPCAKIPQSIGSFLLFPFPLSTINSHLSTSTRGFLLPNQLPTHRILSHVLALSNHRRQYSHRKEISVVRRTRSR